MAGVAIPWSPRLLRELPQGLLRLQGSGRQGPEKRVRIITIIEPPAPYNVTIMESGRQAVLGLVLDTIDEGPLRWRLPAHRREDASPQYILVR